MGWAATYIQQLQEEKTFQFRPKGFSMAGIVDNNDLVTVEPATVESVMEGDVVLCRVAGGECLHIVKSKDSKGRCMIGNNKGHLNGWTKAVYGKCIKVEK